MKRLPFGILRLSLAWFLATTAARGQAPVDDTRSVDKNATDTATERDYHQTRWERVTQEPDASGNIVEKRSSWVQLEHGLNYWDPEANAWAESREEIELTPTGAVARHGQHRVLFSNNVNDPNGAVDFEVNHQARLRASVLALRYYDPASGKDQTLGLVKDTVGELLPPNQVIYRNAFDGLNADVVYTVRKEGLEADIVLREVPPSPQEAGLRDASEAVRIEVVTEFFESPEPTKEARILASVEDPAVRAQVAEPDWVDEELNFGANRISEGRAFAWSSREAALARPTDFAPVAKRWIPSPGVNQPAVLIEAVEYVALFDDLLALPGDPKRIEELKERRRAWAGGRASASPLHAALSKWTQEAGRETVKVAARVLPKRRLAAASPINPKPLSIASASAKNLPGLVLDWTSLNSSPANYVFSGDETYRITGNCWFSGTTVLEGGAVLKFPKWVSQFTGICLQGPLDCRTSAYRPAVFTAEDDNTVGESIVAGSPDLSATYGNMPLRFKDIGVPIVVEHIRVKHADNGIYFQGNNPDNTVRHAQFVRCLNPIANTATTPIRLRNVLIDASRSGGRVFTGASTGTVVTGEHVTIHSAPSLLTTCTVVLTNSFVVAVTTVQSYSGSGNHQSSSAAGLFETVGAGGFYLPASSPHRNAGLTSIDPLLARDLKSLTVSAPLVLSTDVTLDTVLSPAVSRDLDTPDRGYHYPPIDYCLSNIGVTGATLRLDGGVVVAFYGPKGIVLRSGAKLVSEGSPNIPNRLIRYHNVQEATLDWGSAGTTSFSMLEANPAGGTVPTINMRFNEIGLMAVSPTNSLARRFLTVGGSAIARPVAISHSHFRGVSLEQTAPTSDSLTLALTNNFFERAHTTFADSSGGGSVTLTAYNNLFFKGKVSFDNADGSSSLTLKDNLFDADTATASGTYTATHNGFRSGMTAFGSSNKTGLVADYAIGSAGRWYYPRTGTSTSLTNLFNAGSRTADAAGLYHFSTVPDGSKELGTTVDIGFHYPATGTPVNWNGLLGHWRLNEGTGTTAADASPNGFNGSLVSGPTWTNGPSGGALSFAANAKVSVPDNAALRLTTGMTLALWAYKGAETAEWPLYIGKKAGTLWNYALYDLDGTNAQVMFHYMDVPNSYPSLYSNGVVPVGVWTHIAATWTGNQITIYINGLFDRTTAENRIPATGTDPLEFGLIHTIASTHMLDEVSIHNRALSDQEVWDLSRLTALDTDSDGTPDVVEDRDGDGVFDPGETDWTQSPSGPGAALQVYTPLR